MNALRVRVDESGAAKFDPDDLSRNLASLSAAEASEENDLVGFVHHNHYVANASLDPRRVEQWRVEFAHAIIDAGASWYVAHGQPFVQAIEIYRGAPIFYGMVRNSDQTHMWQPLSV